MQTLMSPFGVAVVWAPLGLLLVVAACLAGIRRLGRGQRWRVPAGLWRRLAAVALLGVAGGAMAVLAAMAPVSGRLFRIHRGIGTRVPEVVFRSVADGTPRSLAEFKGKVVVLNIWATWCPSCIREMPSFNRLQAAYGERGVVVVNLSDESRDQLLEFARQRPMQTVSGFVESFAWGWFDPGEMRPFTLFIDRDGYYRDMVLSGEVTYEQLDAQLRPYL